MSFLHRFILRLLAPTTNETEASLLLHNMCSVPFVRWAPPHEPKNLLVYSCTISTRYSTSAIILLGCMQVLFQCTRFMILHKSHSFSTSNVSLGHLFYNQRRNLSANVWDSNGFTSVCDCSQSHNGGCGKSIGYLLWMMCVL